MTWHQLTKTVEISSAPIPEHRSSCYGDGFFTTMSVYQGKIYGESHHHQRLCDHAVALYLDIDADDILQQAQQFATQIQEGIIKIIISREPQTLRGYGFQTQKAEIWLKATSCRLASHQQLSLDKISSPIFQANAEQASSFDLLTSKLLPVSDAIEAVCLSARLSCQPPHLVGLKTLNRLENVIATKQLNQLQQSHPNLKEGLMKNLENYWIEGTASNLFYQLDHQPTWYTPPIIISGVKGTMRQAIIDILTAHRVPILERYLSDSDLTQMSRLFFCNAVKGMMPVTHLWQVNHHDNQPCLLQSFHSKTSV